MFIVNSLISPAGEDNLCNLERRLSSRQKVATALRRANSLPSGTEFALRDLFITPVQGHIGRLFRESVLNSTNCVSVDPAGRDQNSDRYLRR